MRHFVLFILISTITSPTFSQSLPIIKANGKTGQFKIDDVLQSDSWTISPQIRPDVYDVYIEKNVVVQFITDSDSISFDMKPGDFRQFVVLLNGKDSAFTAIKGNVDVPRAHFSEAYKKAHSGKTFVEIPPVYELLNIVFSITEEGKKDNGLIRKDLPYYAEVQKWFGKYAHDKYVEYINGELKKDGYSPFKMDAYAFELNGDKISKSKVYDRIGFAPSSFLAPKIADLEAFAQKSDFQQFYKNHQPFYQKLIAAYRDSIGVPEMQKWLIQNFPSTKYDSFKIIFSPLVSANQSATWFDYDGFKEAQAHVNFPYRNAAQLTKWSKEALLIREGDIVFTELNHAFIGPESAKPAYASRIEKAFSDLTVWNDYQKPARYYDTPHSSFDEYMNWALVNLRYMDYAPKRELGKLVTGIEDSMKNYRGFRKFPEFNQFLMKTYAGRKSGQTVADLYPAIVAWFETNNK